MVERVFFKYSQENLSKALQEVRAKTMSANKASKTYGIPKGTLMNKLHLGTDVICKMGPKSILSEDEEEVVKKYIFDMAKIGYPLNKEEGFAKKVRH